MTNKVQVGEVILIEGAGPLGNPLRCTVEKVTKRHVEFRTAMGDGKCTIKQWHKYRREAND